VTVCLNVVVSGDDVVVRQVTQITSVACIEACVVHVRFDTQHEAFPLPIGTDHCAAGEHRIIAVNAVAKITAQVIKNGFAEVAKVRTGQAPIDFGIVPGSAGINAQVHTRPVIN